MAPGLLTDHVRNRFLSLGVTVRRLIHAPGFTVAMVATFAICLGANLTIFSVVDGVLVRRLPYVQPDRLMTLYYTYPHLATAQDGASLTNYYERRGKLPAFATLSAISLTSSVIGESGATALEPMGRVTTEFFQTLGVPLLRGRGFTEEEMTYQTDNVAVISFERWQSAYHKDPEILGRKVKINGIGRTIVGVLPPNFRVMAFNAPFYMPYSSEASERSTNRRHNGGAILIGRLAPGVTQSQAQSQVDALDTVQAPEFVDAKIVADAGAHTVVAPLQADTVKTVRPALLALQGAALCLLLIAVVNAANLLLTRTSGRARELAIRQVLGADRGRLAAEMVGEAMILTAVGGGLGLLLAYGGVGVCRALGADQLPLGTRIAFDGRTAAVGGALSLGIGLVLGLAMAAIGLRSRVDAGLQSSSRSVTAGRPTQRLRQSFIVTQIALAFVLLSGAALLARSLMNVVSVAPGFRPDHVLTGRISLTWQGYHSTESYDGFFGRLTDVARQIPGVAAVGMISEIPSGPTHSTNVVTVPGQSAVAGAEVSLHDFFAIAGDYCGAMKIPLLAGRLLDADDARAHRQVCLIDEAFARQYWPGENAVGKRFYRDSRIGPSDQWYTVVGVVGSVKQSGLTETKARGAMYFTYQDAFFRDFVIVARTRLEPAAVAAGLAKAVRQVDPDMPLTDVQTMQERLDDSVAPRRTPVIVAGIFSVVAVFLAAIGLYGVMAYGVGLRTREFGVRIAVGALPRNILSLVLREGARLAFVGLAIGFVGFALLRDALAGFLFNVSPADPVATIAVVAVVVIATLPACLIPSFRATRVDPVRALRAE